ncbi:hypothetical protein B4098_0864 [Heyndrickxia coagulans]|uniref:Uncharacterized protein n=1 Tax=Heyndrickxia coagulans TaxID=1398 RepID=A0A150K4X2_HEYCO|nr:hypothetical protein B4098_0864 [Heyndrickxia coagulans]
MRYDPQSGPRPALGFLKQGRAIHQENMDVFYVNKRLKIPSLS